MTTPKTAIRGLAILSLLLLLMIPESHASTIVDYEIPNTTCFPAVMPGFYKAIEAYDNQVFLWCKMGGTYGFLKFFVDTNQVDFYKVDQGMTYQEGAYMWYKIDKDGNIWFRISDGIARLDTSTRELTRYYFDYSPIDILIENASSVWLSFWGGVSHLNPSTGELKKYLIMSENDSAKYPYGFYPYRMGLVGMKIYVLIFAEGIPLDGFTADLLGTFDIASQEFSYYNMTAYDMIVDHQNNIWVTGHGIGLLDPELMMVTRFPLGAPFESISFVPTIDNQGNLWFASLDQSHGASPYPVELVKFNPVDKTVTTYQLNGRMSGQLFPLDLAVDMNDNIWLADSDISRNVTRISKISIGEPYVTVSRTCTMDIVYYDTTTGGLWVTSTSTMDYCTRIPETSTLTSASLSYNRTTYTTRNETRTTDSQSTLGNLSATSQTFQQTLYSYTVPEFMSPVLIVVLACVAVTLLRRRLRTAAPTACSVISEAHQV